MKNQQLKYTFVNPNDTNTTLKAIQKMIVEKIVQLESNRNTLTAKATT